MIKILILIIGILVFMRTDNIVLENDNPELSLLDLKLRLRRLKNQK